MITLKWVKIIEKRKNHSQRVKITPKKSENHSKIVYFTFFFLGGGAHRRTGSCPYVSSQKSAIHPFGVIFTRFWGDFHSFRVFFTLFNDFHSFKSDHFTHFTLREIVCSGFNGRNFAYRLCSVTLFDLCTLGDNVLPGNYGMMDQIEALRWIQQNIAGKTKMV